MTPDFAVKVAMSIYVYVNIIECIPTPYFRRLYLPNTFIFRKLEVKFPYILNLLAQLLKPVKPKSDEKY